MTRISVERPCPIHGLYDQPSHTAHGGCTGSSRRVLSPGHYPYLIEAAVDRSLAKLRDLDRDYSHEVEMAATFAARAILDALADQGKEETE